MTYKQAINCVIRIADGAVIPLDQSNGDYAAYLAWVQAGGVPEPAADPISTTTTDTAP